MAENAATVNNLRFIIQASKGLIRARRARRSLMFYSVLAVLVLTFAGATFSPLDSHAHPLLFMGYWALCAWLTLLSVLLAFYDMASVRLEATRERERLAQEYLDPEKK